MHGLKELGRIFGHAQLCETGRIDAFEAWHAAAYAFGLWNEHLWSQFGYGFIVILRVVIGMMVCIIGLGGQRVCAFEIRGYGRRVVRYGYSWMCLCSVIGLIGVLSTFRIITDYFGLLRSGHCSLWCV